MVKDARSNKSEVFAERIVRVIVRNQGGIRLLRFAIHLTRFRRDIFEVRNKGANLNQDWRAAHANDVGRRVERGVRHVDDISQSNASNETHGKAHHKKLEEIRIDGIRICHRLGKYFHLIRIDVAHEGELFQALLVLIEHRLEGLDRELLRRNRLAILRDRSNLFVLRLNI